MQRSSIVSLILFGALLIAAPRWMPESKDKDGNSSKKDQARVRVCIYHIVAGKQLEFLKWMATQDEVAREAGNPTVQLYAHLDGDSWDYIGIGPATTLEQDRKADEVAVKKGLKIGFPSALKFRELVESHTDTFAAGPVSAADLVALAGREAP